MSISSSNEFFINMKNTPSKDSEEYKPFYREEKRKCEEGIWIDGVFVSPWLYWHLNHWKILKDGDNKKRILGHPDLRDNEWIISEAITKAEKELEALCILGLRQMGKTIISSSYSAHKGTFIKGGQNVIVGGSKPDLNNITQSIDLGLQNVTPYFRIPRITRDWSKPEVYLGVKSKDGDNKIHSSFRIRNTEGGKNTEAVAGATTSSLLFDEIAKNDFIEAYNSAKPSLIGKYGWRCSPILTGTGGSFEKGRQTEVMFFNPESNDILEFINEETGKKTGLFMPGWLRSDFKKITTLSDYLNIDSEALKQIPIEVSDKEHGIKVLTEERRIAATDPESSTLLKAMMYYPLNVDEIFLTEGDNIFPKDLLLDQKQFLAKSAPPVDSVEPYIDATNQIRFNFSDKKPILHYPMRPEDNKEGVVQIWEPPIQDAPDGMYIAGTDPYKFSESAYSDSVGSTFIFKRVYDIVTDKFQNMIVASYHGRPKKIDTWYQNTKKLLRMYNAKTLCENMDYGFIQHCVDKNEAHLYLIPTPKFLYDVHPNSTVGEKRIYGIHMTKEIKSYLYTCILEYITSPIKKEEDGTEILGVRKIIDPMLLEEMLKFTPDSNTDRIISFGLVLALAKSLDRIPITSQKDSRFTELYSPNLRKKGPFSGASIPFRKLK